MPGEDVEQRELSFTVGRNAARCSRSEDTSAVSHKAKHPPARQCSNRTARSLSKGVEDYSHTKTCTRVLTAAFSITASSWEQAGCPSLSEWVSRVWSVQTRKQYSALKRKEQFHDILEKAEVRQQSNDQWLPGVKETGVGRQSAGEFQGSASSLHDTVRGDVCHPTFAQSHRMCSTRASPEVSDGVCGWAIVMSQ